MTISRIVLVNFIWNSKGIKTLVKLLSCVRIECRFVQMSVIIELCVLCLKCEAFPLPNKRVGGAYWGVLCKLRFYRINIKT